MSAWCAARAWSSCLVLALGCGDSTLWIGRDRVGAPADAATDATSNPPADAAQDGALAEPDGGEGIDPSLLPPGAPRDSVYLLWLFDGADLTVAEDSSGNDREGTLAGGPSLSDPAPTTRTANVRGRFFNGTGEHASYGGDALPAALTLGLWVKPSLASAASLFARAAGTGALELTISAAGVFELRSPGQQAMQACVPATACLSSSTQVVADAWHHLTVTVSSGGAARLFVNGKDEGGITLPPLPVTAGMLELGTSSVSARPGLRGVLDEVVVYSRVLTPLEIASLAASR